MKRLREEEKSSEEGASAAKEAKVLRGQKRKRVSK
jgi:hypothetical protein